MCSYLKGFENMNTREELTLEEVKEITGLGKSTLLNKFKSCIPNLEKNGITYKGKGRKRKFYKEEKVKSIEEIAFEVFKQIAYNVWKFSRKTDVESLLLFMGLVLWNQKNTSIYSYYPLETIAKVVGVEKKTIQRYKKKLVDNNIIMPIHLSKVVTVVSKLEEETQVITSKLVEDKLNKLNKLDQEPSKDRFKYSIKLIKNKTIKQKEDCFCMVDNSLFDSYLRACVYVANTRNLKKLDDRLKVKKLIENEENLLTLLKPTKKDRYIAMQEFKKELAIDKLYQRHKIEFTPSFLRDKEMLDILVRAFKFSNNNSAFNRKLEQYKINY